MKEQIITVLLVILGVVLGSLAFEFSKMRYEECRAHGFSKIYCIGQ